MNKARIIFIVLSLYIFAAFGWWTYAHYSNNQTIYQQQKELLENSCYKATFDLHGAIDQQLFDDTLGLRTFFEANYPDLEVVFLDVYLPLNNFMVRPQLASYKQLEKTYKRKLIMYVTEGGVMMLLLFWGVIVIYRSFKKELYLNRLQANFLLSITHELKTPLTAMKLYMETLLKRQITPEQTRTIVENSLNETKRLQDQVETLLLSAQLDSRRYQLENQTINFSEMALEVVANFNKQLDHPIKADIQEQVVLNADPSALEMILSNLLTNALKYGQSPSGIEVKLSQSKNETLLSVLDQGPGISDEAKKMVFNKFYRLGDENTRKTKGTGLGLFIVKHLVDLHHGKISVRDNEPKGTIFEIKLHSDAN